MTQHRLFNQIVDWLHGLTNVTINTCGNILTITYIDSDKKVTITPSKSNKSRYTLHYAHGSTQLDLEIYSDKDLWIIESPCLLGDPSIFSKNALMEF